MPDNMDTMFYNQIFPGNRVLIFIPHEDDELNIAGALISGLRHDNYRVICVFSTNGDHGYLAETRIKEAMQSLKILGVPAEDIVFLGYPDGGTDAARCVFMNGREKALNEGCRTKTYGMAGKPEFCMSHHGFHRPYTWDGFCEDIRDLLLYYQPDSIVGVDFDSHPDHRMCSIALEQVVGELLNRETNDWHPLVLKAFAYNTGFESVKDFYGENLQSTRFNRERIMDSRLETDNPVYEWNRRLRLPVPSNCRTPLLKDNLIFQAARCHLSQRAMLRADRIINSDEVFWVRRTDNLIFQGNVTVSSGEGKYLHDFCMICTRDIRPRHNVMMEDCLWIPDAGDSLRSCRCTFKKPQHVEAVSLYGDPGNRGRILKSRLVFSTGYSCEISSLRPWGQETVVAFPPQDHVEWVEYQILETEGAQAGISEWEIFANRKLPCRMLHILADGHFAYEWRVPCGEPGPAITAYTYGINESVRWSWDGEACTLEDIQKKCACITEAHVIRADAEGLCNEISLIPISFWQRKKRTMLIMMDRLYLWLEKQRIKPAHHKLRMLKKKQKMTENQKDT